jgi:flagellar basal body rod protein FlgG
MSDAGTAVFNHDIRIADDGQIGSASDADAMTINSSGVVTFSQNPVATLATAAQANITSLGTLTALTVDDVAIDGKVITMTGSTDDTAVLTVATNGALTLETTDTAAAAANIQITADGTFEVDSTTITLDSAGDIVLDAGGNDFNFKSGGTEVLRISNSSSDVIIKPTVDTKDIIFQQFDGTEVARVEDNGTFNVATAKLAINGTAITSTAAELNHVDGVTSAVQTQLDTKASTGKAIAMAIVFG